MSLWDYALREERMICSGSGRGPIASPKLSGYRKEKPVADFVRKAVDHFLRSRLGNDVTWQSYMAALPQVGAELRVPEIDPGVDERVHIGMF